MYDQIWHGRLGGLRLVMMLAVMGLVVIGLVSINAADRAGSPQTHFAQKQLQWIALGVFVFFAANLIPYHFLGRYSYVFFGLSLILLVVVLVGKYLVLWGILEEKNPFVPQIKGAFRWIKLIPLQSDSAVVRAARIQPSEVAKIAYIIALAWYLRYRKNYRTLSGLIGPFVLSLVPMGLILLEPDLGTILLFLPVLFTVLFVAGAKVKHLLTIILLAVAFSPVFYFLMEPYQRQRIEIMFNQNTDDAFWLRDAGYQLYRSKISIGTGQVTGNGWDLNPSARRFLPPEVHNDFVFSLVAHQWGFVGGVGLLFLFSLLILGGIEVAAQQPEPFGRLLAVGFTSLIATQIFINTAMTMGLMPITGLTLPFVSYGGSSMLCNFLAFGLLINVARHRPMRLAPKSFEFGR
ncbi:MAG: rod shape-determining protein RodA [Planctomycetes bacterium]|nr:rod shape-determining protein RodA [Planctomycetota bacterium]